MRSVKKLNSNVFQNLTSYGNYLLKFIDSKHCHLETISAVLELVTISTYCMYISVHTATSKELGESKM